MTTTATPIPASHVYVSTAEYERSHWQPPRGRGSWGFFIDGDPNVFWAASYDSTYRDAKRAAVIEAASRGVNYISVAP